MIKTIYYQDLTKMNTFGMKVKARCFMEYDSVADLVDIDFEELSRPILHMGGGSNLLFTDDFKGTILHSKVNFIEILDVDAGSTDKVLVSVGAGVVFDDFCRWACSEGLWGVENLSYIPGEVGASAVQNIGAYGVEAKDVIHTVYCYDTIEEEFVSFPVDACAYGYRESIFKSPEVKGRYIVTHVVFTLSKVPSPKLDYGHLGEAVAKEMERQGVSQIEKSLALIRNTIIRIRKEKLPEPSVMGSAGSFFKNPVISRDHFSRIEAQAKKEYGPEYKVPHYVVQVDKDGSDSEKDGQNDSGTEMIKIPAAWMIEQCGWKGRRSGGAAVYEKQPLVIVNYTGNAYPEEILNLEKRIITSVAEKFDVVLHPEVEHV